MFEHESEAKLMGENGYNQILSSYSPVQHYNQLMKLFNQIVKK